jgi:hypothetical protein
MKGGDGGAGTGGGGGGGAASGPAVFVNTGSLALNNVTATGSAATAGVGGTGLAGHGGSAGTANLTSLFNYAGTVNSTGTTGPLSLLDPPVSVPTLNEWMMLLFALLLMGTGWKILYGKRKRSAF